MPYGRTGRPEWTNSKFLQLCMTQIRNGYIFVYLMVQNLLFHLRAFIFSKRFVDTSPEITHTPNFKFLIMKNVGTTTLCKMHMIPYAYDSQLQKLCVTHRTLDDLAPGQSMVLPLQMHRAQYSDIIVNYTGLFDRQYYLHHSGTTTQYFAGVFHVPDGVVYGRYTSLSA